MNEAPSSRPGVGNHQRTSVPNLMREIIEELKEFFSTRLQVAKSELQQTLTYIKAALPLTLIALVFVFTAFLLFTSAAVALVALVFTGNPWSWVIALASVGAAWTLVGIASGYLAYNRLRTRIGFPKRTLEVLKADRAWLQSEASTMQRGRL